MKLIKKLLTASLALLMLIGFAPISNAEYSSQDTPSDFFFLKGKKPEVSNSDIQLIDHNEKTNSSLLKLDMEKYESATFNLEYEKNITGWTFNLGDSISNDGWGGDYGNQSNDAEIEIVNKDLNGYLSDQAYSEKRIAIDQAKIVPDYGTISITLNSNGSISWTNNKDKKGEFSSPHFFALSGQKDHEGSVNYDVFVGLNRVIAGSRIGEGLKSAKIILVKKYNIIPTKELIGGVENVSVPEVVNTDEPFFVTVSGYLPNPSYKLKELKVTKAPTVHGGTDCILKGNCPPLPLIITITPVMEKISDSNSTIEMIVEYKESVKVAVEKGWRLALIKVIGSNQTIENKIKVVDDNLRDPIPSTDKLIPNEANLRGIFKESDNEKYEYQLIGLSGEKLVYLTIGNTDIDYSSYLDKGVKINGTRIDNPLMASEICFNEKARKSSASTNSSGYTTMYNNKEIDDDSDEYENEDDSEDDINEYDAEKEIRGSQNNDRKNKPICFDLNRTRSSALTINKIALIETGESITNSVQDKYNADIIPFMDIDEDNWARDYIKTLKSNNVIKGFNDGTFKPERSITYAEAGKMVLISFGIDYEEYSGTSITEENLADWQKQVIEALIENGIVNDKDVFVKLANKDAKRGDIIEMLIKGSGLDISIPSGKYFKDVTIFEEEAPYIEKAKELEIIKGYEDGTFRPYSNVRRDEFAKMVSETLGKI